MNSVLYKSAHEIKLNPDSIKVLKINVASIKIEINCLFGSHFGEFRPYLAEFQRPEISVNISREEIDRERLKHPEIQFEHIKVSKNVAITYDYGCLEPFIVLNKLADAVVLLDAIMMHGSVVAKDDYAYMFTAPSGVGKTTRTRIFLDTYSSSIVVNGDKPLIKITDTQVIACGTPWCGKEGWNTNTMVPLRAIFLLERVEEGEDSSIEEISLGKAFPFLLQQTHRPEDPDLMRKTLSLLKSLEGKVKIYRFRSTPTEESVRLAYETAKPQ